MIDVRIYNGVFYAPLAGLKSKKGQRLKTPRTGKGNQETIENTCECGTYNCQNSESSGLEVLKPKTNIQLAEEQRKTNS